MEIQIYNPTKAQPLPPIQWNYPELKQQIVSGLERYKGVVYDETQIVEAKKDRAALNKLADAIDSKRKEMKALYLHPYEEFEAQAKELTALIKKQADEIAAQIKAYDEFRKKEKLEKIKTEIYAPMIGSLAELIPYARLHDPKWLNVTTSTTAISQDLGGKIDRIVSGLAAIDKLNLAPDMASRIKDVFLRSFDLAAALAEKERIERQQAELARYAEAAARKNAADEETRRSNENTRVQPENAAEAKKQPEIAQEKVYDLVFRIHVTEYQMKILGDFMRSNGIKPERV